MMARTTSNTAMQPPIQRLVRSLQGYVTCEASWLTVRLWLSAILSTAADTVDVIAFLALGRLLTADITNLVVVVAHYVTRQIHPRRNLQ